MATINTTTANTARTSTKKHAFTFDHINKQIVGTGIAFQKAGIPGSDLEAYLAIYEGELAEEMRVQFAKMKAQKEQKKMTYPTIKSWFLDLFPHFNVNKAKTAIKSSNLEKKKAPYKVIKVSVNTALLAEQRKQGLQ